MPDPIITNLDTGNVIYKDPSYEEGLITFTGAGTLAEGTILARDSVSGNFVPYVIGGSSNGNGVPKAILTYPVTAAGAGNVTARPAVKGHFIKSRSVVDADGDDSNITSAIRDELRGYGILLVDVSELNILDNQ